MSQRRLHSLGEAVLNNLISFGVAYSINLVVLPEFRRHLTTKEEAFWLTVIFSVVSIVRQYFIRRLFNWWHHHRNQCPNTSRLNSESPPTPNSSTSSSKNPVERP